MKRKVSKKRKVSSRITNFLSVVITVVNVELTFLRRILHAAAMLLLDVSVIVFCLMFLLKTLGK